MLKQLRFRNWRSLRDVTIENLTPITVFVGANSSGKSNIVDGLQFVQFAAVRNDAHEAILAWGGLEKIRSVGAKPDNPVEIGLGYSVERGGEIFDDLTEITPHETGTVSTGYGRSFRHRFGDDDRILELAEHFRTRRWQILREHFFPRLSLRADELRQYSAYMIDPLAHNVAYILSGMRLIDPPSYKQLQDDLTFLLDHVQTLEIEQTDRETRLYINERRLGGQEAPTISDGALRIVAMLTAYYALDMRLSDLPGLVVIEEPDTAIHPLLLRNFVDLLRGYTGREGAPRQFILTTHNPRLVNLFKPEEVRIVERSAEGVTTVEAVPQDIAEVWREEYGEHRVGDAWMTRALGGVPE